MPLLPKELKFMLSLLEVCFVDNISEEKEGEEGKGMEKGKSYFVSKNWG